jgi:hypothetical protein
MSSGTSSTEVKQVIQKLRKAAADLEAVRPVRPVRPGNRPDRRHGSERRLSSLSLLEALRAELDLAKLQIHHNTLNLEIQFARIAQIQTELDRLLGASAPRFKGDRSSRSRP